MTKDGWVLAGLLVMCMVMCMVLSVVPSDAGLITFDRLKKGIDVRLCDFEGVHFDAFTRVDSSHWESVELPVEGGKDRYVSPVDSGYEYIQMTFDVGVTSIIMALGGHVSISSLRLEAFDMEGSRVINGMTTIRIQENIVEATFKKEVMFIKVGLFYHEDVQLYCVEYATPYDNAPAAIKAKPAVWQSGIGEYRNWRTPERRTRHPRHCY